MSVYVDPLCDYGWKFGPSCHLWADSVEELQAFAARISMREDWFQPHASLPHYDLTAGRRRLAVALGAIELDRRGAVMKWQSLRGGAGNVNSSGG